MSTEVTQRPRWSFLWIDDAKYDGDGDGGAWRTRMYGPTFEAACAKMLAWAESRTFEVRIDHEACAEHVPYDPKNHEDHFPNLRKTCLKELIH